jgi:hypothetical protein
VSKGSYAGPVTAVAFSIDGTLLLSGVSSSVGVAECVAVLTHLLSFVFQELETSCVSTLSRQELNLESITSLMT